MRTLCVACHYDVTAAQRAERRVMRSKAKEQLKVIMRELKYNQNMVEIDSDSKVISENLGLPRESSEYVDTQR